MKHDFRPAKVLKVLQCLKSWSICHWLLRNILPIYTFIQKIWSHLQKWNWFEYAQKRQVRMYWHGSHFYHGFDKFEWLPTNFCDESWIETDLAFNLRSRLTTSKIKPTCFQPTSPAYNLMSDVIVSQCLSTMCSHSCSEAQSWENRWQTALRKQGNGWLDQNIGTRTGNNGYFYGQITHIRRSVKSIL